LRESDLLGRRSLRLLAEGGQRQENLIVPALGREEHPIGRLATIGAYLVDISAEVAGDRMPLI
jgi:hypothetical protein